MNLNLGGMLGVRTVDGAVVPLLDLRQAAPGRAVFTTTVDRQSLAVFDFYYRGGPSAAWTYLDSLSLPRIPPAPAGEPDLKVEATLDAAGNLVLQMHDPSSGQPAGFVLEKAKLERLLAAQPAASTPVPSAPAAPTPAASATVPSRPAASTPVPTASAPSESIGRHPEARPSRGEKRLRPLLLSLALVLGVGLLAGGLVLKLGRRSPAGRPAGQPAAPGRPASADIGLQAVPDSVPAPAAAAAPAALAVPAAAVPPALAVPAAPAPPAPAVPAAAIPPAPAAPAAAGTSAPRGTASAAPVGSRPGPARHAISWGDTLWRIAERYYGERGLYRELAESNALKDPDLIITGRTLLLPPTLAEHERKIQGE